MKKFPAFALLETMFGISIAGFALATLFMYVSHLMQTTFKTIEFARYIENTHIVFSAVSPLCSKKNISGKESTSLLQKNYTLRQFNGGVFGGIKSLNGVFYDNDLVHIVYVGDSKQKA